MEKRRMCEEWEPVMALLVVEVIYGVVNTFIKQSLNEGLNGLVIITLRQLIATLFMAPFAYFFERKNRPKLTWWIVMYTFLSAMLGVSLAQYLFIIGLKYTSATFGCAFLNLVPVFTFLVALPFRLETLNLKSITGKGKTIATVTCLGGTLVLMFFKGTPLTYTARAHMEATAQTTTSANTTLTWILGSLALFGGCLSWSTWFLVQTKINKIYPVVYSSTTIMFFMSALQAVAMTLASTRDLSVWILKGKVEIFTVVFSGVMGSGIGTLILSWCVLKRGPVFTAAFSPLIQVVVAIIDFSFLRVPLYFGSVLGSVIVILGLYVLLWAKHKEAQICAIKPSVNCRNGDEGNDDNKLDI